eukprot:TRINITY_DN87_c1_g1_i1.p1 TRINITY_DN87_c1_g1~~TRINITY_DN87_c1_g1_i1.p1  ORF type:complete len:174 (+),score=14.92 TRINITY_DN87_c1_g1_i1:49-570(+)
MIKNFSTKAKLMLVPIVYVIIVAIVTIVYKSYDNTVQKRIEAASQTEIFIQQVLKGRIAVYQFLRTPNEQKAQNVVKSFETLDNNVKDLKSKLDNKENIEICNLILKASESYIKYFEQFSKKRIQEYNQGLEKESDDLKVLVSKMVETGLELEKKLNNINENAKKSRKNGKRK